MTSGQVTGGRWLIGKFENCMFKDNPNEHEQQIAECVSPSPPEPLLPPSSTLLPHPHLIIMISVMIMISLIIMISVMITTASPSSPRCCSEDLPASFFKVARGITSTWCQWGLENQNNCHQCITCGWMETLLRLPSAC